MKKVTPKAKTGKMVNPNPTAKASPMKSGGKVMAKTGRTITKDQPLNAQNSGMAKYGKSMTKAMYGKSMMKKGGAKKGK
jgi:hypothetical protein